GRCIGVRIQRHRLPRRLGNPAQVLGVVHASELLARGRARRDDLDALGLPALRHHFHDLGTLGPLWMARRRLVLGETIGMDEDDGHRALIVVQRARAASPPSWGRGCSAAAWGSAASRPPGESAGLRGLLKPPTQACDIVSGQIWPYRSWSAN